MISPLCFRLAREREVVKLRLLNCWPVGVGRHVVQLERVNPSPSPTHSAQENEWAKAEDVLHAASGCLRGTHLIRGPGFGLGILSIFGLWSRSGFCTNICSHVGSRDQVPNQLSSDAMLPRRHNIPIAKPNCNESCGNVKIAFNSLGPLSSSLEQFRCLNVKGDERLTMKEVAAELEAGSRLKHLYVGFGYEDSEHIVSMLIV
ncbi:hypothetical protein H5410_045303 [Solanum commersonii]|uniref:Uncharacterized protein n=1 Tax=Solanum commersonii TaxID=4109 RepID=A0A9J5XB91_SOLCO|nr:hypothetical protein H5410_045303 [Solanum commersonii]